MKQEYKTYNIFYKLNEIKAFLTQNQKNIKRLIFNNLSTEDT